MCKNGRTVSTAALKIAVQNCEKFQNLPTTGQDLGSFVMTSYWPFHIRGYIVAVTKRSNRIWNLRAITTLEAQIAAAKSWKYEGDDMSRSTSDASVILLTLFGIVVFLIWLLWWSNEIFLYCIFFSWIRINNLKFTKIIFRPESQTLFEQKKPLVKNGNRLSGLV